MKPERLKDDWKPNEKQSQESARMAYLRGMGDRQVGKEVQFQMGNSPPADYEFANGRPSWANKRKVKKPVMGAFIALIVGSVAILGVRMILWILGNALHLDWGYAERVPAAVLIVAGVTTVFMGLGQIDTEKSVFMTMAGFIMVAAAVVVLV